MRAQWSILLIRATVSVVRYGRRRDQRCRFGNLGAGKTLRCCYDDLTSNLSWSDVGVDTIAYSDGLDAS
jgi:hypothetical protein